MINKVKNIKVSINENWYIMNIIHLLYELSNHNVNLDWIPGHSDIKGNEIADKLAREADSF